MDEDDPDFSKTLIVQFFDQAIQTFDSIETELKTSKDLAKLDSLGHFLKGSSATLGMQRIAWVCERIQYLARKEENSFPDNISLLNQLSEKDSIYLKNLDLNDNKNFKNLVILNKTETNYTHLSLISNALIQAKIEFQLAKFELSRFYKTEL